MSSTLPTVDHLDFDAFIRAYGENEVRYEMYDSEVFAMGGGSRKHGEV